MANAFLDADRIRAASFVRHVEIHDTLGSTNVRAAELARESNIELPALVVARCQTAGRGRGQHTWWSAEGALTFSLLLDTTAFGIDARSWPQLSLATAVAVCDALAMEAEPFSDYRAQDGVAGVEALRAPSGTGGSPSARPQPPNRHNNENDALGPARLGLGIKWPNDVTLNGGKVCGILIESPGGIAPARGRLILGIGINVNNSWHSAPREAGASGIALCDVTRRAHDLQNVLANALNSMRERIEQLAANDSDLPAAWQRLSWLTGQRVEVHAGRNWIGGICLGINADGSLLVENVLGTHRVHSGSARVR